MRPFKSNVGILCSFVAISCGCWLGHLNAQETFTTPSGNSIVLPAGMSAEQRAAILQSQSMRPGVVPGAAAAPNANPATPNDAQKKDEKKNEESGAAKEGDENKPLENIKRTAEPPGEPDPKEFDVGPDDDGLLYFQFRNQPWPAVLRWYAEVSHLSFDWQELPGDYINLATQRPHTLEEAGDLINRALLMRGFTMLQDDATLTVAKVEGLNPALVPRVAPSELSNLPPHRFVRTSFSLSWLLAEQVHEEFNSMISKNGKLTPLQSTNRLEAIDAAANLRDIHDILEQEQSALAMQNLAKEFPLKYARAASVKEQLQQFLGIESSAPMSGNFSSNAARMMQQQMQQQMQQMQRQMQQAARNNNNANPAAGASRRPRADQVYLVANERANSVIVHAPPNKMAIIASFIARVDIPNESAADFQRLNTRMKVFRLASLGPTELVASLTAMDVLEPSTRLQVDEENNAIIAYASIADQYMIQSVIDRLDGSERRFEVVQLRRLDAESVAGSIKFLMGTDEDDSDDNMRRRIYGYYPYGGGQEKKTDKMRVGANVQDNQLLLWVNDIEMEEVQNLLVKLGELPPEGGNSSTVRVIDASRQPETYEYLKRLKEQWDRVSPNPLTIPDAAEFDPPSEEDAEAGDTQPNATSPEKDQPNEEQPVSPSERITSADDSPNVPLARDVKLTSAPASDPPQEAETAGAAAIPKANQDFLDDIQPESNSALERAQQAAEAAPVEIFLDERGNIVIRSDDTSALDRLERIMQTNRPPTRPYDVFKVKYASASWVTLNLEEYFEKQQESEGRPQIFFSIYDALGGNDDDDAQLGKKPPLRFIWDNDTNSIVVQGADDVDRQTIKELIELWDVPEEVDTSMLRYTELVRIKYSRAENIVNTIKEAYRDLLSANDKTFQEDGGDGGDSESKRGGGGSARDGNFTFSGLKGKLSLGADPLTNSILISVEGEELLKIIKGIITDLDEAAIDRGTVEVVRVTGNLDGASLKKALAAVLGAPAAAQKQQQNQNQNQNPNQNAQPGQQPNVQVEQFQGAAPARNGRGRR